MARDGESNHESLLSVGQKNFGGDTHSGSHPSQAVAKDLPERGQGNDKRN
jgi:hypothetical protein